LDMPDAAQIKIGTGDDLLIYQDGTASIIKHNTTGQLFFMGDDIRFVNQANNNAIMYLIGDVIQFHGNSTRPDGTHSYFGTGNDLDMYHDGSNSWIRDVGTGDLFIDSNSGVRLYGNGAENMLYAQPNGGVHSYYDNVEKMRTEAIGVRVFGDITLDTGNADGPSFRISSAGYNDQEFDNYTGNLRFINSGAEQIRVEQGGNTSIYGDLNVTGGGGTNSIYFDVTSGNGYGLRFWNGSESYKIYMANHGASGAGRVDGETTSDYNMYYRMTGGTNRGFVWQNNTTNIGGLDASGNFRVKGDVVAYTTSDIRYKEDIIPIPNAIEKIKKLSGNTFIWNNKQTTYETGTKDVGVIAQEVEEVLPEIVHTKSDGHKAVKYEKIVALLIEGMKEQQEEIDKLKKQIEEMK
jgi:hypothetical protein